MTRSTVKRLTKPLDEPEREFRSRRKAALRSHQNESLAIAERNLFDDEASSYNTGAKPPMPPETLNKHSHPNYSSFLNLIAFPTEQTERIVDSRDICKFEDELANFMLEKKSHAKGIGDILVQHRKELREQYSQILSTINKSEAPKPEAPTFAITTRSGISTQDPPFLTPPRPATDNFTEGETERGGPESAEPSIIQEPAPQPSILCQPSKSSNLPFPSRLKKQKKDDEDERLLSIFKQIHINLPFLEPMIHILKGANVLKDLLSHKEKLEKAVSSVKLSEECSVITQRSLPQKEGDPGSFILPCLIGLLAVKNALANLGASINLMPHSLFR
ncbi:hypothetical protein Tco_1569214 [Tanacetum coccineum]